MSADSTTERIEEREKKTLKDEKYSQLPEKKHVVFVFYSVSFQLFVCCNSAALH